MTKDTFPSSTVFHYPILLLLADGKAHKVNDMMSKCVEHLKISEANQNVTTKSGKNKVHSWIRFANHKGRLYYNVSWHGFSKQP